MYPSRDVTLISEIMNSFMPYMTGLLWAGLNQQTSISVTYADISSKRWDMPFFSKVHWHMYISLNIIFLFLFNECNYFCCFTWLLLRWLLEKFYKLISFLCLLEEPKATQCVDCLVSGNPHVHFPMMLHITSLSIEISCFAQEATKRILKRSCF